MAFALPPGARRVRGAASAGGRAVCARRRAVARRPQAPPRAPRRLRPLAQLPGLKEDDTKDVDPRIIEAVEALSATSRRITVADVAARAGVDLALAEKQVVLLASLTSGVVEVTQEGLLVYKFAPAVRQELGSRSFRAALRERATALTPLLLKVGKASFGAFLFASIAIAFTAIAVLSSSSDRDSDDRSSSRDGGGGGGGYWGLRMGVDIADMMFNPYYRSPSLYYRDEYGEPKPQLNFLESIYSFVFGDGNPNANLEETRYKSIVQIIRDNNGAVTAEQLAPFLDPPEAYLQRVREVAAHAPGDPIDSYVVDESFVLPVITRFGGHPEVTATGDIVYIFPDLQRSGGRDRVVEAASARYLAESEYKFSEASGLQMFGVVLLGVVNQVGVSTLADMVAQRGGVSGDAQTILAVVGVVLPFMVAYAWTFFLAPAVRALYNWRANRKIRSRNAARKASLQWLQSGAPEIRRKLRAARDYRPGTEIIGDRDVIYSSETGVDAAQESKWDDVSSTSSAEELERLRIKINKQENDKMWDGLV